ncbi:MAG: hypothetical protein RLZZ47_1453 [Bacteroidota bacterium]
MIEAQRIQFLDYIAKTKRMSVHTVSAYSGDLLQFMELQSGPCTWFYGDVIGEWTYCPICASQGVECKGLVQVFAQAGSVESGSVE